MNKVTDRCYSCLGPPAGPVRWPIAVMAGLLVGTIFFLFSRGLPWASSGFVSPTLMGREIKPPEEVSWSLSVVVILLHMGLSVLYALMIAPAVNWIRGVPALFMGGLIGLILYGVNFGLFASVLSNFAEQREIPALITHLAFGMVAAGAYKGMARRSEAEMAATS
jgi:hypothetical protein